MKLKRLKIKGFKNLTGDDGWFDLDFTDKEGITVLIGNNGSGKSNVLEAISAIFAGLYDKKLRPDFSYVLEYQIRGENVKIDYNYHDGEMGIKITGSKKQPVGFKGKAKIITYTVAGNSIPESKYKDYLPSKVIAGYSGEEIRLYKEYYSSFYEKYIKEVISSKKSIAEDWPMTFISKDHWNVALLTMAVSEVDMKEIISDRIIDKIILEYNEKNVKDFNSKNPNEVTRFIQSLYEIDDLDLEKVKILPLTKTHEDLYKMLSVALLPKESSYRLVDSMRLIFNNDGICSFHLSEGEKKQILIYFILEILADKDALILLDEPDSYIHIGNKERLKNNFKKYNEYFREGEVVITTHSPTLMYHFDDKNLVFLEDGKIEGKEKRNILDKITNGRISFSQTELFLNSKKPLFIAVEGKTDEKHIKLAAKKLDIDLEFDIYSCGGADKLKQFLCGIPMNIFDDKIIIGIFDYDCEGIKQLKKVGESIEDNKKYKKNGSDNVFGISLPCEGDLEQHQNCPIEYLYPREKLDEAEILTKKRLDEVNRFFDDDADKLNLTQLNEKIDLCFYKISESETSKNSFAESCNGFDVDDFEGFKKLFDLIIEIKNTNF